MEEDGWWQFLDLVKKVQDKKQLQDLFDLFFTHEEREDFAKRYLVVRALLQNELPQREIAQKYHVSIFKITRGSNALKRVSKQVKELLFKNMT
jgi:TrpR family trp operon transcriptional repressor